MRDLFTQLEVATRHGLYYLSLFGCLAIPDICGAMESDEGLTNKGRYVAWFEANVADRYGGGNKWQTLTGEDCYYFRCSMLHQGSAQHPKSKYSRIIFVEPATAIARGLTMHNNVFNDVLNIDVTIFCADLIDAGKRWLASYEESANYKRNYPKFIQRYPNGLAPYIAGVPVIG